MEGRLALMTLNSGYCLDKFHDKCVEFYYGKFEHNCTCECHKEET